MPQLVYYLGISLLITHEMDAVMHSEWRLLYVLRDLEESAAFSWFLSFHVPMFFLILWLGHHQNLRIRSFFRIAASLFLIIHAGLHFRLQDHAKYEFDGLVSDTLIFGAGACGLVFLLLSFVATRANQNKG